MIPNNLRLKPEHFEKSAGWWQWDHLRVSGFGDMPFGMGWLLHTKYAFVKSNQLLWGAIQGYLHTLCPFFMPFWAEKDALIVAEQIKERMKLREEL